MSLYAQKHDQCPTCTCTQPIDMEVIHTVDTADVSDPIAQLRQWVRNATSIESITTDHARRILDAIDQA